MFISNCCFLTCKQVSQEAGQVVWYSHLFKNFPQFIVIHTVKGFGIVNKEEIDVFLELSRFFDDPTDVGNLISGSSAFSKTSLNIWKFMVHVLLKPGLENFKHYFISVWDECNCVVVWTFFVIADEPEIKLPTSVHYYLLLPDLHTGLSRGRSGGLVFPSLSEFIYSYMCVSHLVMSSSLWSHEL